MIRKESDPLFKFYKQKFEQYGEVYQKIVSTPELDKQKKYLSYLYNSLKAVAPKFYIKGEMDELYEGLLERVWDSEEAIQDGFIIESVPDFKTSYLNVFPISLKNDEEILDWLVAKGRQRLINRNGVYNLDEVSLENECAYASKYVKHLCADLRINCKDVKITPGYNKNVLCGGYHHFNVVSIQDHHYLVDLTYRQFFTHQRNSFDRIGVVGFSGGKPGKFMILTEDRLKLASKILKKGYIELTKENLKTYLDGFTLSYRNGLYYETTNDYSYLTDYTPEAYVKMLSGRDNMLNHEPKHFIGRQNKPLTRIRKEN